MNAEETMQLLSRISLYDWRTFTAAHAVAWSEILTEVRYADAVAAVVGYYAGPDRYPMKPGDIAAGAAAIRRARIGVEPAPVPPVDPSDTAGYIGWVKAWTKARGDGSTVEEAQALADRALGVARQIEPASPRVIDLDGVGRDT